MWEKPDLKLGELESKLGIKFQNIQLLEIALTHRSFLNEARWHIQDPEHNERLEFLGDAVLELVVTRYLYMHYRNPEGELTSWRAMLVNSNTLFEVAEKIGINNFLLLSRGEAKDTGKARKYLLADVFEALVGALYLDQGYEVAEEFLKRELILPRKPVTFEKKDVYDAKSFFQELAQEATGITPRYEILRESGPDHSKSFTMGVFLENALIGKGKGTSKKEAQDAAARVALQRRFPDRIQ